MYEDEKNKKKNSDTEKKETGRDSGGKPCSAQDIADCNVIREPPSAYGNQASRKENEEPLFGEYGSYGPYTIEDYMALPEDLKVELIDGTFYEILAPTTIHQAVGGYIYKILLDHVLANKGPCMPFVAPVDVQLDEDDKTMVQPDVLIVCDRKRFQHGRVFGAPDFLVEVLSPSTRKKDMQYKLHKYGRAGVREYWIVDPKKKNVIVYDLEHDAFPVIYGENDVVPVRIWDGKCQVEFSQLFSFIAFLYDL